MCLPFPDCIPAEVDIQFIGYDQVGLVSSQVDVEFGGGPVIMIGVESHADQVAHAVIVSIPDKRDHLIRADIFTIDAYVDVFIIVEQFDTGWGIRYTAFVRDDLDKAVGPLPLLHPEIFVQASVHHRLRSRHFRYIINALVGVFERNNRVLLCMTEGTE